MEPIPATQQVYAVTFTEKNDRTLGYVFPFSLVPVCFLFVVCLSSPVFPLIVDEATGGGACQSPWMCASSRASS